MYIEKKARVVTGELITEILCRAILIINCASGNEPELPRLSPHMVAADHQQFSTQYNIGLLDACIPGPGITITIGFCCP